MKYSQAVQKLHDFVRIAGVKPGLERIKKILRILGDPEKQIPVIHIAGTNGKGSVTLMTSQALIACGYRVGTYLSPHLIKYNERFLFAGKPISDPEFARYFTKVFMAAQKVKGITEFEVLTAMAFLYFQDKKIDVAVMEVGLGGAYDATNVCRSILSVITPISFDHENILGRTLTKITKEKAGIIKKNVPVVSAAQEPEVLRVIMQAAEKHETEVQIINHPLKFKLPFLGNYQRYNAALVIAGLQALLKYKIYIPRRLMLNGISQTRIPGRTELFSEKPVTILDVAHNPQGIRNILQVALEKYPYKKKILIFGLLQRKNLPKIVLEFKDKVDILIAVNLRSPEAFANTEIKAAALQAAIPEIICAPNVKSAYQLAKTLARKQKSIVLVAGSFYLIGEFYQVFAKGKIY